MAGDTPFGFFYSGTFLLYGSVISPRNRWSAIFLTLIAIGVLAGVRQWILWNLNAFLITNQRIIDFDQSGLFHRRVSEASYEKFRT